METLKADTITNMMSANTLSALNLRKLQFKQKLPTLTMQVKKQKRHRSVVKKQHSLTRLRKLPPIISFFNTEITKQHIK